MNITHLLEKRMSGLFFSTQEACDLLVSMTEKHMSSVHITAILVALRTAGETPDEILGFIQTMRKTMAHVHAPGAIDVCGTGGDGMGTFNISTAAAFVTAGAGARVAKHGNRAASSKSGSADVLEALGINIHLTPKQAKQILDNTGMVFLFAPLFHPAMKHVVEVRKELGVRTIFNVLGPFCNPAGVTRQIIGVPDTKTAALLAQTARNLSYDHLCILTADGMDEASIVSPTTVFEIRGQTIEKSILDPSDFGFSTSSKTDIRGGNAPHNACIIQDVLDGMPGPRRDIVVFNSALALCAAGVAKDIREGITRSQHSIDSGRAKTILTRLREETRRYV